MTNWRRTLLASLAVLSLSLGTWANPAVPAEVEANTGTIVRFVTLPDRSPGHPEGLTADGDGNIYAASFELTESTTCDPSPLLNYIPPGRKGPGGEPLCPFARNYIYVYAPSGRLLASVPLPPAVVPLGMVTSGGDLYVNDVFNGDLLRYTLPLTANSSPTRTYSICGGFIQAFPGGTPASFCALNANDVGPDGRIYMSDNGAGPQVVGPPGFLQGRIWVLDPDSGRSSIFYSPMSGELNVNGFPQFGVNGVAFNPTGTALYMANMSTDTIYALSVSGCLTTAGCVAGSLSTFIRGNGIDGPDNIDFDDQGNLWIASGQNDKVIAVNPAGQITRQFGAFQGFTNDGAPRGLLQPSGLIVSKGKVYVGNESNITLRPEGAGFFAPLRAFTISRVTP